jgi:hypothetical protein
MTWQPVFAAARPEDGQTLTAHGQKSTGAKIRYWNGPVTRIQAFPVILWNKIPATRIEAILIDSIDVIESPPK